MIVMKYKWEGCWGFGFIVDEGRLEVYLFRLVIEVLRDEGSEEKEMTEQHYAVPEGMLKAADKAVREIMPRRVPFDVGYGVLAPETVIVIALEAALRWQSESGPVPTEDEHYRMMRELLEEQTEEVSRQLPPGVTFWFSREIFKKWFGRMYLAAPEPERKDGDVEWNADHSAPIGIWYKGKILTTNVPQPEPSVPEEIKIFPAPKKILDARGERLRVALEKARWVIPPTNGNELIELDIASFVAALDVAD